MYLWDMKKVRYTDWVPLGWQGFLMRIPAEWNPGRITGGFHSGSIRLDDTEMVRMELEWRGDREDVAISSTVDRFVEELEKQIQRKSGPLEVHRPFAMPGTRGRLSGDDQETIFWETDFRVYALARRFRKSKRLAFIRIIGKLKEDILGVARDILLSLEDQDPEVPGIWALYDLLCHIPQGFDLDTSTLRSGHIQLRFLDGETTLQVDRLSMAGVLLRERSLQDWFEDFYDKLLRDLDFHIEPFSGQRHPGIRLEGRPKSRLRGFLSPLPFLYAKKRFFLEGWAWHCPESNKIFAALTVYKREGEAAPLEEVCREVVCHPSKSPDQSRSDAYLKTHPE